MNAISRDNKRKPQGTVNSLRLHEIFQRNEPAQLNGFMGHIVVGDYECSHRPQKSMLERLLGRRMATKCKLDFILIMKRHRATGGFSGRG